jgi:nicotinate-nucleotide adenylyltransferase
MKEPSRPTLCLGGTFNPIHHGHLIGARAVAEARHYEHVALIPTATPPHKPIANDLASANDRLEMCRLSVHESKLFTIEDIELKRSGPSFTIDTAHELARRGWGKVHWLIGADMLNYLPKWHRASQLIREVEFVIIARPGMELDWKSLPAEFQHLKENVVTAPLVEISATDIRKRVSAGLTIDYLTPEPVCRYIRDRGLYR